MASSAVALRDASNVEGGLVYWQATQANAFGERGLISNNGGRKKWITRSWIMNQLFLDALLTSNARSIRRQRRSKRTVDVNDGRIGHWMQLKIFMCRQCPVRVRN